MLTTLKPFPYAMPHPTLDQCHRDTQFNILRMAHEVTADPDRLYDIWCRYQDSCRAVEQVPKFAEFQQAYANGWRA